MVVLLWVAIGLSAGWVTSALTGGARMSRRGSVQPGPAGNRAGLESWRPR